MDPLTAIAGYTTPTQSQTPSGQEKDDNDSQKRKRHGNRPTKTPPKKEITNPKPNAHSE